MDTPNMALWSELSEVDSQDLRQDSEGSQVQPSEQSGLEKLKSVDHDEGVIAAEPRQAKRARSEGCSPIEWVLRLSSVFDMEPVQRKHWLVASGCTGTNAPSLALKVERLSSCYIVDS